MARNLKCVYISAEVHTLLKQLSLELNTPMKDLLEEFIQEGIRRDAQYDPAVRQVLRYLPRPGLSSFPWPGLDFLSRRGDRVF